MAARFWVGGGSTNSWTATANTNWSLTSGGAGNQTVPGASDDATFDGLGAAGNGASTIPAAGITLLSLTFTSGYTAAVTISGLLTLNGNLTDNTAHTYVNGGGSLTLNATCTIASGGRAWPTAVAFSGTTPTYTLNGNWSISGAVTFGGSGAKVLNRTTAETLTIAGGFNVGQNMSGTATVILSGGTWQGNSALSNSLNLAGNITVSGSPLYQTGTLTYVSGIITTTGTTLQLNSTCTLNTNGVTWANVSNPGGGTITLNSTLTMTGTLTCDTTVTFAGTSGWSCATFSCSSVGAITITLASTVTYTITSSFSCFTSRTGAIVLFASSSGSVQAILTLTGITCNVLASFTRIDASNGRAIWTFNGTITTCSNIFSITNLSFVTGKPKVVQANNSF